MSHAGRPEPKSTKTSRGSLQFASEPGTAGTLGTAGLSTFGSNSQEFSRTEDNPEAISPSENRRIRGLKDREEIMESFRRGKSMKTETITSILRSLGEIADVSFTQSGR